MPRKVFVAGEILTAADVNTNLMDQSVMVFDDATDRATAIPTPVEGMVTYLKDTDAVEKFDGDAFVNVSSPIAGIGSNVVSGTTSSNFSTASTSFQSVTGLVATITPTLSTSKVLVLAGGPRLTQNNSGNRVETRVIADSGATDINIADQNVGLNFGISPFSGSFLHSPATTSAVVYQVQVRSDGGGTVQMSAGSNIVLIEVAV